MTVDRLIRGPLIRGNAAGDVIGLGCAFAAMAVLYIGAALGVLWWWMR